MHDQGVVLKVIRDLVEKLRRRCMRKVISDLLTVENSRRV
jgi:hypothetical protein